jgi:hypothetical protein
MREIKFRAWDKRHKEMCPVVSLTWWNDYATLTAALGPPIKTSNLDPADFELMQYTGLKDKNGKEIYEGDILLRERRNFPVEFYQGKCGPCVGDNIMVWRLAAFHNSWNGPEVEVIGNIHENPELIEQSDTSRRRV